jgi:hypothetical protein
MRRAGAKMSQQQSNHLLAGSRPSDAWDTLQFEEERRSPAKKIALAGAGGARFR